MRLPAAGIALVLFLSGCPADSTPPVYLDTDVLEPSDIPADPGGQADESSPRLEIADSPEDNLSLDGGAELDLLEFADPGSEGSPDLPDLEPADTFESKDSPDVEDDTAEPDLPPVCPHGEGVCEGLTYLTCLPGSFETVTEDCSDAGVCHTGTCKHAVGCSKIPLDGVACDDGSACTVGDACAEGACLPGAQVPCNDGNECTDDSCDPVAGCLFVPAQDKLCDDQNSCTEGDHCVDGACVQAQNLCDCVNNEDCLELEDDNPCNGVPVCEDGQCNQDVSAVPDCSAVPSPPCGVPVCDPETGGCIVQALADDTPCEDNNLCTAGDHCVAGECVPGSGLDCNDDFQCTLDSCDPDTGCVNLEVEGPCDDGNLCTLGDFCWGHMCASGLEFADCDDGNPCTEDFCEQATGCGSKVVPGADPCDDGDPCTVADACVGDVCQGEPMECLDGETCVDGLCGCPAPCGEKVCGLDGCGQSCGVCQQWEECQGGTCIPTYAPPHYGPYLGDTVPNQQYLDPEDLSTVEFGDFFGVGKLILVTYSAGWCIVCKNDTWLLNSWHADWADDGLTVLEINYEKTDSSPIDQDFALAWKESNIIQYHYWMDTPTADPDGEAEGGGLAYFMEPVGPLDSGTFPNTFLLCPQTMEILYIDDGFHDNVIEPLVKFYLFEQNCADE